MGSFTLYGKPGAGIDLLGSMTKRNSGDIELGDGEELDSSDDIVAGLIKAGIDPARLETDGFGDTRPIAPNMTPRGRELNRRVEFVIETAR